MEVNIPLLKSSSNASNASNVLELSWQTKLLQQYQIGYCADHWGLESSVLLSRHNTRNFRRRQSKIEGHPFPTFIHTHPNPYLNKYF